jgi:hypothetical protein
MSRSMLNDIVTSVSAIDALAGRGSIATGLGSRDGITESGARRLTSILDRLQSTPGGGDPLRYFRSPTMQP